MKAIKNILSAGLLAFLLAGCQTEYDYEKKISIADPAQISLSVEGSESVYAMMSPKTATLTIQVKAATKADEMLMFTIAADPSLVDAYNSAKGTSYEAVPADAYSLSGEELMLPRYNDCSSTLSIKLLSANMPEDDQVHLLPLTITKVNIAEKVAMTDDSKTVYILFRRKLLPASGFEFGTGTESDPYQIYTPIDMFAISKALKSGVTSHFKLMNDVDMSEEDWIAINQAENDSYVVFDGDNHKISGLSCDSDNASIFGYLVGTVKNLTIEGAKFVSGLGNTKTGCIASVFGSNDVRSTIENVTVKGLVIESKGVIGRGDGVGGLVGQANNADFRNCSVDLIVRDGDDDKTKMPRDIGGLVGYTEHTPCSFENCTVQGSVVGYTYTAGVIGQAYVAGCTFKKCYADVDVQALHQYGAGFIGYGLDNTTLEDCGAKGDVTVASHYCGGFAGGFSGANLVVKRCYAEGKVISNGGNHVGAFIGNPGRVDTATNLLIENCYASGDLEQHPSNARMVGGFFGCIENVKDITVRNCYASGSVTSEYMQVGGIAAIVKDSNPLSNDIEFTMQGCIAWNKKVSCDAATLANWSSGAMIGVVNSKSTLNNNWRRSDMEFMDGVTGRTLSDSPDATPSTPLPNKENGTNDYHYHGKAAPAGYTCSQVAMAAGWDESVWDLAGDLPKLK